MIDQYLSIIIPAYNESNRIGPTLKIISEYMARQTYAYEVIIVDDGSTDNTVEQVELFTTGRPNFRLIRHRINEGKGRAVKTGMKSATGRFRLFSDADLSTPIEEVENLLKWTDQAPIVIASRRIAGAHLGKRQPFHREASGRIFSLLVRLIVLPGFLDTQCGFKLFSAAAAEKIFDRQSMDGFCFDVELLYIGVKILNLKVVEAPVQWYDSPLSRVRLFQDSFKMFFDLILIRLRSARGFYD